MKTSELTGAALDWAVAKAWQPVYSDKVLVDSLTAGYDGIGGYHEAFNPSTDWAQGGPLIERERITIRFWDNTPGVHAYMPCSENWYSGPTPLIAAMRCYVASKLGEEVEVPDELT